MKYASVVAPLLIAVSAEAMNSGRAGTVPECVAHRGSVWAMCGSKEVGKWGVGTEGTEQAIVNCNSAAVHSDKLGKCPETIPRCMAHKGSVWAMCGSKEAGKWGVGTEGTEQAIKNCDWAAVHRNKFGKCPDPAVAPCLHTTCAMVDGRMIVNNRAHNLPGGNIATYDHIVAGTVWQAMEHAHCMFYHGSQRCECHCHPDGPLGFHHAGAVKDRLLRPRDGGWGDWGSWSPCPPDSGDPERARTQDRSRRCDTPLPRGLGKTCEGSNYESRPCTGDADMS